MLERRIMNLFGEECLFLLGSVVWSVSRFDVQGPGTHEWGFAAALSGGSDTAREGVCLCRGDGRRSNRLRDTWADLSTRGVWDLLPAAPRNDSTNSLHGMEALHKILRFRVKDTATNEGSSPPPPVQ